MERRSSAATIRHVKQGPRAPSRRSRVTGSSTTAASSAPKLATVFALREMPTSGATTAPAGFRRQAAQRWGRCSRTARPAGRGAAAPTGRCGQALEPPPRFVPSIPVSTIIGTPKSLEFATPVLFLDELVLLFSLVAHGQCAFKIQPGRAKVIARQADTLERPAPIVNTSPPAAGPQELVGAKFRCRVARCREHPPPPLRAASRLLSSWGPQPPAIASRRLAAPRKPPVSNSATPSMKSAAGSRARRRSTCCSPTPVTSARSAGCTVQPGPRRRPRPTLSGDAAGSATLKVSGGLVEGAAPSRSASSSPSATWGAVSQRRAAHRGDAGPVRQARRLWSNRFAPMLLRTTA